MAGGGVDVDGGLQMEAVWEAREGVHGGFGLDAAGGKALDLRDGHALGVVHPFADEGLDGFEAVLRAQLFEPLLADPGAGEHAEVVAVPDLGCADALAAHADDVADILIVLLDLDAGEDEGAFRVDVDGVGHVGGGEGVPDIGLVRFDAGREDVLAFVEDGDDDGVVGGMGVAEVGVVVEEGVALLEVGVEVGHGLAEEAGAVDVDGSPLRSGEELVLCGGDGGGEVTGDEGRGAGRADEGIGHLAGDAVDAVGHDEQLDGVHR